MEFKWHRFDFYSESEYIINFEGNEKNYFSASPELGITLFNNFRAGISENRTKLIHSVLVFQRGIFAQYTFRKLAAGVHNFNPHSSDGFVLLSFDHEF